MGLRIVRIKINFSWIQGHLKRRTHSDLCFYCTIALLLCGCCCSNSFSGFVDRNLNYINCRILYMQKKSVTKPQEANPLHTNSISSYSKQKWAISKAFSKSKGSCSFGPACHAEDGRGRKNWDPVEFHNSTQGLGFFRWHHTTIITLL